MKANLIYETLDFERGKDPKESMGIGLKFFPIIGINIGYNGWLLGHELESIFKELIKDPGYISTNYIIEIKYIDNSHSVGSNIMYLEDLRKKGYDGIKWAQYKLPFKKPIKESINFERGKDPKVSMSVGLSKAILNGLKLLEKDLLVRKSLTIFTIYPSSRKTTYTMFPDDANYYITIPAQEIPSKELMWEILSTYLDKEYFLDIWEDNEIYHEWRIFIKDEYAKYFLPFNTLKESLEFERGKDPKTSIGIGIMANIDKDIEKYDKIQQAIQISKNVKYQTLFGKKIIKLIPKRLFGRHGWGNFHLSFKQLTPEEYLPVKKVIDKYYNLIFVNESLEFERGKDTKSALGIGVKARRNFSDIEEAVEWMFRFPEVFSEGDIKKWDYKILRTTNNSQHGTYYYIQYPQIRSHRLKYVKWIRWNLKYNDGSQWGLYESKKALDNLEIFLIERSEKRVNEFMEFERGKDPKTSIGIGLLNKDISKYTRKELEQYYIDILPLLFPDVKDYKTLIMDRGASYLNKEATQIISDFEEANRKKYGLPEAYFNAYEFYFNYLTMPQYYGKSA